MKNEVSGFVFAAAFGCVVAHAAGFAAAQPPTQERGANDGLASRFVIDDADPEHSVPSPQDAIQHPLDMGYFVMLLTERADAADKRGDDAAAIKYYHALAKAVPDRSVAFARLCRAYEAIGDREQAIANCKLVLGKAGAKVEDHSRLVQLMLAKDGTLPLTDIADIDAILDHLDTELAKSQGSAQAGTNARASKRLVQELRCELGARLEDAKRLTACSRALAALTDDSPRHLVYRFALALASHDLDDAERVIGDVRRSGYPPAAVASMNERLTLERARESTFAQRFANDRVWIAGVLGACLVAGLATLLALRRSRRRPATLAARDSHTA